MVIFVVFAAAWFLICFTYAAKELISGDRKELNKSLYLMIFAPLAAVFVLIAFIGVVGGLTIGTLENKSA